MNPSENPAGFPAFTPKPPYVAVIFSSVQRPVDEDAYAATAARMEALVRQQLGFLGVESVRDADGRGITVSYWRDLAAVAEWKHQAEHLLAQQAGRETWYSQFAIRVAQVESAREFQRPTAAPAVVTSSPGIAFADLAASRRDWIQQTLRRWCQRAGCKELLQAEAEWFDIAGKADPAKTLWAWAWSRFPDLVHEDLGIDESAEVEVTLRSQQTIRGYPDARQSVSGRLVLIGDQTRGPYPIDEIVAVRRIV